jgi:hypothetical protein
VPVTNHNVSFEIEDAMPAKVAIDGDEPAAADFPALSATAPLYSAYSTWCG